MSDAHNAITPSIYKGRGDNRLCMYANKRTVQAVTTAVVAIAH